MSRSVFIPYCNQGDFSVNYSFLRTWYRLEFLRKHILVLITRKHILLERERESIVNPPHHHHRHRSCNKSELSFMTRGPWAAFRTWPPTLRLYTGEEVQSNSPKDFDTSPIPSALNIFTFFIQLNIWLHRWGSYENSFNFSQENVKMFIFLVESMTN